MKEVLFIPAAGAAARLGKLWLQEDVADGASLPVQPGVSVLAVSPKACSCAAEGKEPAVLCI